MATPGVNGCINNDRKKVTWTDNYSGWCQFYENGKGLDNLTNSTKPFILYTLACETTPFDTWESIEPTDNLGAQITNLSGKGGPIFLGNTRYGYVSYSWYLQQSFTSILAGGTYQLGAAEAASKGISGSHYVWLSHNLIGCPETEMWTSSPSLLSNSYAIICDDDVIVNTGGITNAVVCVMSSDDGGASYWQVNSSSATEKIFYNVPEPFVVTITKHNYLPKIIQSSEIATGLPNSISGRTLICSTDYYKIENLPDGANVTWSISPNLSVFQLTPNVPSPNQVLIQNKKWYSATTTLFANINTGCGNTVILTKIIGNDNDNSSIQYGSYYQEACYAYNNYFPSQSGTLNGNAVFLYPGCMTEVTLSNMFGKTVSLSGSAQPLYWYYNSSNSKLYLQLPNQSGGIPFVFSITGDGACYSKTLTFFTYSGYNLLFTPNPTAGETTLTIETSSAEKAFDETARWDLEIYSETQLLKTRQTGLRGQSAKIQTAGWQEGVYLVRVNYKGEILTGKLLVKN